MWYTTGEKMIDDRKKATNDYVRSPGQETGLSEPCKHSLQSTRRLRMSSAISTETSVLSTIIIKGPFLDLQITWSMAGSQATPVRPLPGLPVGEIEVPNVTNGEDLVVVVIL